jgi:hypothetical protein
LRTLLEQFAERTDEALNLPLKHLLESEDDVNPIESPNREPR